MPNHAAAGSSGGEMGWLEIKWDESGSVFDDLDRILEGLAPSRPDSPSHVDLDLDDADEDLPSYAWLSHPTLPNAKVWAPVPVKHAAASVVLPEAEALP
jgi:hypothetical protein